MAEVVLENISKSYGDTSVITDLSLTVADKEFLVLVGPSGCGKSTVLRMIAGLEDISEGDLSIGGDRVNDTPPKDRDIAMVFQNYALYPHMNVYDNMAFGLKMRKTEPAVIAEKVNAAAKKLDLDQLLHRKPKELSGGQRQRVALGRAIVRNPKVFLMDEPLSNLDAKLRVQMRTEIAQLHEQLGATTVYVTHDQVEAMTMGDRIVILNGGKIQQVDTPVTVYNHPANLFVANFIGQMNFITGILDGSDLKLGDGTRIPIGEGHDKPTGKAAILGLRPEHFHTNVNGDDQKIDVTPTRIEHLGAEQTVFFNWAGEAVQARLSSEVSTAVGQSLTLYVDLSRASFFDATTEDRF